MKKDLLVICPTRGRIESCARMIKSFDEKTSKQSELIFIIDPDDELYKEYRQLFVNTKHSWFTRGEETLCEIYNQIVELYSDFNFYSITCDDFIYHTGNWDQVLMRKLIEKGGGFAYGDDMFGGPMLPTTCVISGTIVRALGWIVLPTLKYLYGDVVWRELGHKLNRLYYIPEVKIEHMTYLAKKAEKDETALRTNSNEIYTLDSKAFKAWLQKESDNDVAKITAAL